MADYFVASGGSNTAPYDTLAKAATSLQTALTAATADGDRVVIQYDGVPATDSTGTVSLTYTFGGNIALIASTNSGTSTITPTAMDATYWIGTNASGAYNVTLAGAFRVQMFGITVRSGGGNNNAIITVATTDNCHYEMYSCYLWQASTAANQNMLIMGTSNNQSTFVRMSSSTIRLGATSHTVRFRGGRAVLDGCTLSSAGSAPTTFLSNGDAVSGGSVLFEGCDLSHCTGTLVGSHASAPKDYTFVNCKLGAGVTVLATQTPANRGSAQAWVFDCFRGAADTTLKQSQIEYHDAFGSLTTDGTIYANDGALYDGTNRCSWKIVTSANCSYYTPFVTPWFDVYHSGTSAVTPSIEILRDGSTTAYQDDEVWGEWAYKGTNDSTQTTFVNDRKALEAAAANQAAGVGTSGWTGEAASAWSGKLAPASTIAPAEIGHIRGRVYVGEPSITVYVDPQTRLA